MLKDLYTRLGGVSRTILRLLSLYRNNFGSTSLKKVISVASLTKERNSKQENGKKSTLKQDFFIWNKNK
ncbi:hypothetical protein BpHYR1_011391 [Brachionus plicatilis]|uniref:Uncharacterized protein n=1 Tax=Brachionus plicatilis TaxID=10195 RepID=A0A3M7Q2Z4_BRAPC|nr:hypothetical protein BpHYR1_011391 [Brachionus plicatilis]